MKFLRPLRTERKMTQDYMANTLGVTRAAYHRMETETQGIQLASLCKLRRVLGLSWTKLGEILEHEFLDADDKDTNHKKKVRGRRE